MKIATSWSTRPDAATAFSDALAALSAQLNGAPSLLLVYFTETFDAEEIAVCCAGLPSQTHVQGCTSCRGVMTQDGMHGGGHALGMFGIRDPAGAYGVGIAAHGVDPGAAAASALAAALADADRPGETPALVWLNAAPGREEQVLGAITAMIGNSVPVIGGSAADNSVSGRWHLLTRAGVVPDAVAIAVFFPTGRIAHCFQSGYWPTPLHGMVTSASGRVMHEIDGRPAAHVYREWTGQMLADVPDTGGNVLAKTTLAPLGRVVGKLGGVSYFTLAHPDAVLENGSLSLFAEVALGEEVTLMSGSKDTLISRAGRVVDEAIALEKFDREEILGAMVVYCAGCMLTVEAEMPSVVARLRSALHSKPFLGIFTFGEQGSVIDGAATHGNLMISAIVFAA